MKSKLIILLIVFLAVFCQLSTAQVRPAQYADSLEVKFILVDENTKVEILNMLAEHYQRNSPQKALDKSREALDLARKLNDRKNESRALRNIGISLQNLVAEYDSALEYCFNALKISESKMPDLKSEVINNHIAIANIYAQVGNFAKSIDYLTKAELNSVAITDYGSVIQTKILKSKSLLSIDLSNEAIEELKAALKICKLHDLKLDEAKVRMALSEYYLTVFNEELAFLHINIALSILNESESPDELSHALNILASFYSTFNQPKLAIEPLEKSLAFRKYLNDDTGMAECYLFLGLNYNKISRYDLALKNLALCRKLAERLNAKRILRRCYNQHYIAYTNLGNLEKAIEFRDLYVSMIELIFSEESERQVAELQAKMDIEQKDQEIELQKERLDNQNRQLSRERKFNIALVALIILLLGSAAFIFHSYREKKKVNQKLEKINKQFARQNENLTRLNNTKDKFFSIIGHDLKGPLNSLTSFLNLLKNHTSKLSEQEIKNLAGELDKSIKNLYSLLENLLTWARSQTNGIELKPEKVDVTKLIRSSIELLRNQAENKDIDLKFAGDHMMNVFVDKNTIETVIRNLISNSIKFTHPHGKVEIKTEEWKDVVEVTVKDNGIGMSQDVIDKLFRIGTKHTTPGTNKEKGTGLGLVLCKEFVEKNKGFIRVSSTVGVGSKFTFTLPKN